MKNRNTLLVLFVALLFSCYEDNYKERDNGNNGGGDPTPTDTPEIKPFRQIYFEAFRLSENAINSNTCGVGIGIETYRSTEWDSRVSGLSSGLGALADTITSVVHEIDSADCLIFSEIESAAVSFDSTGSYVYDDSDARPSLHFKAVFTNQELDSATASADVISSHWSGWKYLESTSEYVVSLTYLNYIPSFSGFLSGWAANADLTHLKLGGPVLPVDPSPKGIADKKTQVTKDTQDVLTWVVTFK